MRHRAKRQATNATSTFLLVLTLISWAVAPVGAAAHLRLPESFRNNHNALSSSAKGGALQERRESNPVVPRAVRFREVEGHGLLVRTWVNGFGAYTFAVDTGAGATILSPRVAREARVAVEGGRAVGIGGLSGAGVAPGLETSVRSLAVGDRDNLLPSRGLVIVAQNLPADIDGILDPTEAFWPLGYTIDFPNRELSAFDPRTAPIKKGDAPPDGTVVAWLFEASSRRPFVMLAGGRRALLDTGSGYGLAVDETAARAFGIAPVGGRERRERRDLAGGKISARRLRPSTVQIGALALRGVPTDFLSGTYRGAPVLLGRDALRPFQISFDPASRLIEIKPG